MTTVTLPASLNVQTFGDCADFIIDYDQWDDWVPDAVYMQDIGADRQGFIRDLQMARGRGVIETDRFYGCDIYSNDNLKFRTASLPINERALITAGIASHAGAVQKQLQADRLDAFQFRPSTSRGLPEWTGDVFGLAYRTPDAGDSQAELTAMTRSAKPPLFSALDDGLFAAMLLAAQWLRYYDYHEGDSRSVAWRDIRGFYGHISRKQLWNVLTRWGVPEDLTSFLDRVALACGSAGDMGLPPLDDAWGFLASAYLDPVDRALSAVGRPFRRCGDEYFLLAGDRADRESAERVLVAALGKQGLTLNDQKHADLEVVVSMAPGSRLSMVVEAFLMTIWTTKMTAPYVPTDARVGGVAWRRLLEEALAAEPGQGPHARVMTLLRAVNFAREHNVLSLPEATNAIETRTKRYRQALADFRGLPDLLRRRLEQAIRTQRTWACHWLLMLLSDLGSGGMPAWDAIARIATAPQTHPMLRAQAMLTIAKIGNRAKATPLLDRIRPTGWEMADRMNLTAFYFAEKQWGGDWMSRIDDKKHERLRRFLAGRKGNG